jgi:hypothetical protein
VNHSRLGVARPLISIDCAELTVDEQLALAAAISDGLEGLALALVKDTKIVLDQMSNQEPDPSRVEAIVRRFISRRKDSQYYSLEREGTTFVVHSPDPLARARGRREGELPKNLLKCPFCSFVTPYQELYDVHFRSHGFALPV